MGFVLLDRHYVVCALIIVCPFLVDHWCCLSFDFPILIRLSSSFSCKSLEKLNLIFIYHCFCNTSRTTVVTSEAETASKHPLVQHLCSSLVFGLIPIPQSLVFCAVFDKVWQ
jgi:hypothetical protein